MKDKILFFGGLAIVLFCIAIWILFPLYRDARGGYVRRPLWAPPELPIGHGYDLIAKEDIERLNQDPAQREILEGMKNLPRSYRSTPIWLGNRHGPPKNPLGALAFLSVASYVIALRWRGIV